MRGLQGRLNKAGRQAQVKRNNKCRKQGVGGCTVLRSQTAVYLPSGTQRHGAVLARLAAHDKGGQALVTPEAVFGRGQGKQQWRDPFQHTYTHTHTETRTQLTSVRQTTHTGHVAHSMLHHTQGVEQGPVQCRPTSDARPVCEKQADTSFLLARLAVSAVHLRALGTETARRMTTMSC
jgi:hypothetical protein